MSVMPGAQLRLAMPPLWTSVTRGLSLRWIKVFMERSQTMLMDFDIHVAPPSQPATRACLCHEDIVLLLTDFTRVRTLSLAGHCDTIHPIIDPLRSSLLPLQSFSICFYSTSAFILPDDLFGGKGTDSPLRAGRRPRCRASLAPS